MPLAFWLCRLPASLPSAGDGPVRCWLALPWCSVSPLFCERASSALGLSFSRQSFLSLLPFSSPSLWLSHDLGCCLTLAPSDCPQGIQAQSLLLSNAAHASLFSPRLLVVDTSIWATSLLGFVARHVLCGYLFIFFSWLFCPLKFQNSLQTYQWEGFLVFGNFSSFMTPSPGWVSVPNSTVSLFIFSILSYLLSKTMGCLSGCLVSSTSVQKLFCGICSAFKWSFDEFVGRKVVSPSYSSAILGPLRSVFSKGILANTNQNIHYIYFLSKEHMCMEVYKVIWQCLCWKAKIPPSQSQLYPHPILT